MAGLLWVAALVFAVASLLLIGVAWLGAALVLLAEVISDDPAGRLAGFPRLLAVFGLAVIVGSLALMVTIRTLGWPRSFIPPSVRRRSEG